MPSRLLNNPYLRAEKEKGNWHFTAAVNKSWFPADDLFSSLPKGLFSNLEGIKTSGELATIEMNYFRRESFMKYVKSVHSRFSFEEQLIGCTLIFSHIIR